MPKYLRSPQPTVVVLSRQNGNLRVERAGSQMGLVTRSLVEVVNWERVRMSMGPMPQSIDPKGSCRLSYLTWTAHWSMNWKKQGRIEPMKIPSTL